MVPVTEERALYTDSRESQYTQYVIEWKQAQGVMGTSEHIQPLCVIWEIFPRGGDIWAKLFEMSEKNKSRIGILSRQKTWHKQR